ncbi:MAG: PilZ domain-containing protein [Candidatus Omnitrophota bacterium]
MSWDSRERRKFVRVSLPLQISLSNQSYAISTKTENISAGGIRLILKKKLENGLIVNLKIRNIKKEPINCQGRILWVFSRMNSSQENKILYDTGIEFYKIKKDQVKLIKKFTQSLQTLHL